jgi:hypothetical protein
MNIGDVHNKVSILGFSSCGDESLKVAASKIWNIYEILSLLVTLN